MLTDSSRAQRGQQTGQADQRFHTSGGPGGRSAISRSLLTSVLVLASALIIVVLVWQAVVAHGDPDPTAAHGSQAVAVLDIGVLTLREGLECILVLAAITASMVGPTRRYRRPVAAGAAFGFVVTILTWWVAVAIVQDLTQSFSALAVQAVTGLLAIVVLLVVMNWFFHRVYWTGWIAVHTKKKRELVKDAQRQSVPTARVLWGFGLLGFTSLYREGVEVVLFLQSYRLKLGPVPVREGVLIGLVFTAVVAILTFVAHRRLPYRRDARSHRRAPDRGAPRDGGRAGPRDAARPLAADHADSLARLGRATLDGALAIDLPDCPDACSTGDSSGVRLGILCARP